MTILQHGIAQAAAGATGYQIARSLRFNSADSTTLSRTHSAGGSKTTWTYSTWVKRSALSTGGDLGIFSTMPSPQQNRMHFQNTDRIVFLAYNGGGFVFQILTSQVFRDLGAWFHFVAVVDSTNATASERIRLYVNGTRITALDVASYPSQNADCLYNGSTVHEIGGYSSSNIFNGYFAEIHFVDGQALDPSYFGETSTATGVWMPKQVTGMTYGTNGFYLKLDDNSNNTAATLGKDSSGNSNNWTPNNFSVTAGVGNDSLVDSPTNYGTDTGAGGEVRGNYATFNALQNGSEATLTNGNLDVTFSNVNGHAAGSTIAVSSGKWYCEFTRGTSGMLVGLIPASYAGKLSNWPGNSAYGTDSYSYLSDNGNKYNNSSATAYGASYATGDVIGVALDLTAGTLTFYKNGISQGTAFSGLTGSYIFAVGYGSGSSGGTPISANFGQRPFSYTAPSGFKALCTQNLPTPAIGATSSTLASKNMNVVTYTGDGTNNRNITGVGFQPDLVWVKSRSNTYDHQLVDAVRGGGKELYSNLTNAESTLNTIPAFISDGFQVNGGTYAGTNGNGATFVGWAFKGANTTVSNTSGTITSTVSANPTAGISVVSYTGNGTTGATVGHGLGVTPAFIVIKKRSATGNWQCWHKVFTGTQYITLNATTGVTTLSSVYNASPTSSVFQLGNDTDVNASGVTYIAYCFAEVAGFSKFGSYTGNGSADGPFVYTGFRPKFIMAKRTDTSGTNWTIWDTSRNTYNVANARLFPNASDSETVGEGPDILSNGFKLRDTGSGHNASGGTFIYMAFAEAPFQYSRAR